MLSPAAPALAAVPSVDPAKLPPSLSRSVDFTREVQPILQRHCYECHGPQKHKSGFRLDQGASALKGGDNGVDILPGKSAESPLIHYVARLVPDLEMPPKGPALSSEEVGTLRAWIDQGAHWPTAAAGAGAEDPLDW